jgi:hypothetical protein
MTTAEKVLAQLWILRERGSIARSQCSRSLVDAIRPLLDAGVVRDERAGAGRRFVVRNAEAFAEYFRQRFPEAALPESAPSRISGVARFRNSKTLPNDCPEIVCVRSFEEGILRRDGELVAVTDATKLHGIFSFSLEPDSAYSLHGACALVENPAVFFAFEKLETPVQLAIHARGRFSGRLLNWLAAQRDENFEVLHFPDYDPTGLDEYCRLHARLGDRAKLFIPPQMPELFERYSTRDLLGNDTARAILARLRASELPQVREVVSSIDRHNAGLEQEVLLISLSEENPPTSSSKATDWMSCR